MSVNQDEESKENIRKEENIFSRWKRSIIALVTSGAMVGGFFVYNFGSPSVNGIGSLISLGDINIGTNNKYSSREQNDVASTVVSLQSGVVQSPLNGRSQESKMVTSQECLSSEKVVPCDTTHDSEVIANASSCDSDALVGYLGGKDGVDTLAFGISYEPGLISDACKVKFPFSLEESVEGKWVADLRHLPGLRSCFNPDRADQVVGCNEPHTGEVVYSQSGGDGANLSCDAKAADYMDANKDKWQDMLKTKGIEHNGSWLCVAKTRNNNFLDGTLRSLGSQKIKTKPR